MLNHALKYEKLGLSIIPLKPNGKEPLYNWKDYQKRRATEQEVRQWWSVVPNANIGIVTGQVSGIVVVDLDGPEGIESAKKFSLTSPLTSFTGDGKHLWYQYAPNVGNSVRQYPGIDIRGEGGFVVAPPSIHENGNRYRFITPLNLNSLPEFPVALLAQPVLTQNVKVKEEGFGKPQGWIAKALQEMKDGNIDNTLTSILGRLRHDGYSAEDSRLFLSHHAIAAGATPGHLDEKIQNIWNRYEPRSSQVSTISRWNNGMDQQSGLIIHSPTNPDSWSQFNNRQYEVCNRDGLNTGYSKLDQMLKGGLKSSRLFTIAARTGVGKTNWLIGVSRSLCEAGKKVLLFSTEMPYSQIWERYLQTLKNPEQFREHQFYICDSFAPNLEKVEEAINEIKPDVFMFDHINHVSEEQRELGAFMQGLNFIRRKYDCAGIVTAQLNRSADWVDLKTGEKVTPRMSMIKGSGTIEQASSRVLLLSETRVTPEYTEIVGNLDKNDNGPKGLLHFGLFTNPYRMEELK